MTRRDREKPNIPPPPLVQENVWAMIVAGENNNNHNNNELFWSQTLLLGECAELLLHALTA